MKGLIGSKMLQCLRGKTITSIIKKFAFHQSIKATKKKFETKSEFLFNHVSSETIKRIISECV